MPLIVLISYSYFVAEIIGVDMRQPSSQDLMRQIEQAADDHAVLIFRVRRITDEQHVALTRPFGRLQITIRAYRPGFKPRLAPEVADISNLDEDNKTLATHDWRRMSSLGNRQWHNDYTFKESAGADLLKKLKTIMFPSRNFCFFACVEFKDGLFVCRPR